MGTVRKLAMGLGNQTKKTKSLTKIISWNVNGIRACLKKETGLVSLVRETCPDILCLTETKCSEQDNPLDQLRGEDQQLFADYHVYWNAGLKKKGGYSGCAILSKVEPLSVSYGLKGLDEPSSAEYEGRTLTLEFPDYFLVLCYVPNSGQKLERLQYRTTEWDPVMLEYLQELNARKHVLWTGDLNVAHLDMDVHDPKGNRNKTAGFTDVERANFGKVLEGGFVDVFRERYPEEKECFTYWSYRRDARAQNKGWRLDYFVASAGLLESVQDIEILSEQTGSDHCPLQLVLV